MLEEQPELLNSLLRKGDISLGLPQDIQRAILLVAFSPYNSDGLMFTSPTMMRIINPHHSIKQQAGPCHEQTNSVRQKVPKAVGSTK